MGITAVSAPSTITAASTATSGSSKYTAIVDKYAKALAPGSQASLDDQLEAWSGLEKLLLTPASDGKGSILLQEGNKTDGEKASTALINTDLLKKICGAESRLARVQDNQIPERIAAGVNSNGSKFFLEALNKLSTDDQKLAFAGNNNGGGWEAAGVGRFDSLNDYKTYLKTQADAFDRQRANQPATAAPDSSADPAALSALDAANAPGAADMVKSKAAALLTGKGSLTPTAPGMVNAAVALQVLQAAADAKEAQDAQTKGGKPHHGGDAAPGPSPTATPDPASSSTGTDSVSALAAAAAQSGKASATTAGIDKTAAQPAVQAPSITLKV